MNLSSNEPKGIGGWLLLFILYECFLYLPLNVPGYFRNINLLHAKASALSFYFYIFLFCLFILVGLYAIWIGIVLMQKRKEAIAKAKAYLRIRIYLSALILLTTFISLTKWGTSEYTFDTLAFVAVWVIVIPLIWMQYLDNSKRVRNTLS